MRSDYVTQSYFLRAIINPTFVFQQLRAATSGALAEPSKFWGYLDPKIHLQQSRWKKTQVLSLVVITAVPAHRAAPSMALCSQGRMGWGKFLFKAAGKSRNRLRGLFRLEEPSDPVPKCHMPRALKSLQVWGLTTALGV